MTPVTETSNEQLSALGFSVTKQQQTTEMLTRLKEIIPPILLTPPNEEVQIGGYFLGMDTAQIVHEDRIGPFIQSIDNLDLFPRYWQYFPSDGAFWQHCFGITIESQRVDNISQAVSVSREIEGRRYSIQMIEKGVGNETSDRIKMVIAALAIARDALWSQIEEHGFISGIIGDSIKTREWKISDDAILVIPDRENVFHDIDFQDYTAVQAQKYFKILTSSEFCNFLDSLPDNGVTRNLNYVSYLNPVGILAYSKNADLEPLPPVED